MTDYSIEDLQGIARKLRRHVITMISTAGSGHPGGSLSAADIVTALYFRVMRHDPANPKWPDRDRFILSKGHAAPILYAALAECRYFPLEWLTTLRKTGTCLQGHTDSTLTPGVDMSAGSLGQGLSVGIGMALAARLDKKDYRTYVMLGDGECQEGQVWEAAMFAPNYKLDNLTAIVDYNGIQLDGFTNKIMDLEPFVEKWRSFKWEVLQIDGHDMKQVVDALQKSAQIKGKPVVIVARTVKGKGVSFMENNVDYHGKAPGKSEIETALKELA
ncbi:MAG: transketolase [Dehalococcoidia bacterium]|nr:transketolase [Dehalococcoidia bacterium]